MQKLLDQKVIGTGFILALWFVLVVLHLTPAEPLVCAFGSIVAAVFTNHAVVNWHALTAAGVQQVAPAVAQEPAIQEAVQVVKAIAPVVEAVEKESK